MEAIFGPMGYTAIGTLQPNAMLMTGLSCLSSHVCVHDSVEVLCLDPWILLPSKNVKI